MFEAGIYQKRRESLRQKVSSGILLFPGNNESSMNYAANTYHYRQDSNFLYFFGLDSAGIAGICDADTGIDTIYGDDIEIDDIIWMGEQPKISDRAAKVGVKQVKSFKNLQQDLKEALSKGRKVHILPPYRGDTVIQLKELLSTNVDKVKDFVSQELIKAVVALREIKDEGEIKEIEFAVDIAYKMHTTAMKMAFPGTWEREVAGMVEGVSLANGAAVSFPVILSMDGQTLHNHYHGNMLKEGRLMVTDAGSESPLHYASDITRTSPVGGKFDQRQKEIYEIVLKANMEAIKASAPGILNRDVHFKAAEIIAGGLKDLGLMKGDVKEAVKAGAHALFFPHGLGHMMGLDVHDMEGLGENNVGYNETIKRSTQFGTAYLRMAKELKPGMVMTIEPGLYFIPALIDLWKSEGKYKDFINFEKVESYKDFGGVRIEDDILITSKGCRVLGKAIPKTVEEVEGVMNDV
ncbi:MAG: aminopeptidase P family protein [Bacteroidales bacterium]|nr:aminopeptidase P family protein [Bacteroidales bacterium]MCF8391324.1 aminopeptidase P family protein [Bacteroidales bacterium]